jgi:hypothetical protein
VGVVQELEGVKVELPLVLLHTGIPGKGWAIHAPCQRFYEKSEESYREQDEPGWSRRNRCRKHSQKLGNALLALTHATRPFQQKSNRVKACGSEEQADRGQNP